MFLFSGTMIYFSWRYSLSTILLMRNYSTLIEYVYTCRLQHYLILCADMDPHITKPTKSNHNRIGHTAASGHGSRNLGKEQLPYGGKLSESVSHAISKINTHLVNGSTMDITNAGNGTIMITPTSYTKEIKIDGKFGVDFTFGVFWGLHPPSLTITKHYGYHDILPEPLFVPTNTSRSD